MKKRTGITVLLVLVAAGTAVALAQAVTVRVAQSAPGVQTAPSTPSAQTMSSSTSSPNTMSPSTMSPSTSPLASAITADRYTFDLAGFGRVGYYYDKAASSTDRPLLLLTSINAAASAYEMRPIFDAYRGSRPIYVMEWPGFGSSDRPDIRYTPDLMTGALTRMTEIIGRDVDVVALSLGSEFAARAALKEPRIRSLALISPTGLGEAQGATQVAAANQKAEDLYRNLSNPLYAGALYSLIASKFSIGLFLNRSFEGTANTGLVDYSYLTTREPGARYAPLYFISGLLFTPDAFGQLYSNLSVPTLVLYDRDAFVNFSRLGELTQARPNVTAVKVTPTRGLPQFEQLGQVVTALDAFWKGLK